MVWIVLNFIEKLTLNKSVNCETNFRQLGNKQNVTKIVMEKLRLKTIINNDMWAKFTLHLKDNGKNYMTSFLETPNRHAEWPSLSQEVDCTFNIFINLATYRQHPMFRNQGGYSAK